MKTQVTTQQLLPAAPAADTAAPEAADGLTGSALPAFKNYLETTGQKVIVPPTPE